MITTIRMHSNEESRTASCDQKDAAGLLCGNVIDPGERAADDAPWNDAQAIEAALSRGWLIDIFTPGNDKCPEHARAALALPTIPGLVHGVTDVRAGRMTVQCSRCLKTRTDWPLFPCGWATFVTEHQNYDDRGRWLSGERLCPSCREACGCVGCRDDS